MATVSGDGIRRGSKIRQFPGALEVTQRIGTIVAILAVLAYFAVPLGAGIIFSLQDGHGYSVSAYTAIPGAAGFGSALELSLRITGVAVAVLFVLVVPTVVWVHLMFYRWRHILEAVTMLPLALPAIVMATGVLQAFEGQTWLNNSPNILGYEYAVLALPFSYRALDAGLATRDVRTLADAARTLGASWPRIILRVLLPNLRSAIMSASLLTVALSLGEFVLASNLQFNTLPVWLVSVGTANATLSIAVAIAALGASGLVLFVILVLGRGGEHNHGEAR